MKNLSYFIFLFVVSFPFLVKGQAACENGSSQETCAPNIPSDAIVIQGFDSISNTALFCYWVCSGDSLILNNASECSVFLEPKAWFKLSGAGNYVWAKSECKVEITGSAFNTTLGILEDVVFIDDGTNTNETICGISSGLDFDYFFAPDGGCDLTSVDQTIELGSVQFYPNPVSGKSSILMTIQESYYGEINLSDSFGRLVKKWNIEGQNSLDLALDGTSPGVYLIHIPHTSLVKKIVVF